MDVTVCLVTCGEDTEIDCMRSLEEAKGKFAFTEVRGIYPQAAANNAMLQSADSKYIIPVDSDMVLYPGWVSIVESMISTNANSSWYQILFPLWDTLTNRRIAALKVLSVEVMRENPYQDVRVTDLPHFYYMRKNGHLNINLVNENHLPIGQHVVRGPLRCYMRFKDMMICRRHYDWHFDSDWRLYALNEYRSLYNLYQTTGNPDYLYCIAGMADGLTSRDRTSKHFGEPMNFTTDEGLIEIRKILGASLL